jgi:hypothetical protein
MHSEVRAKVFIEQGALFAFSPPQVQASSPQDKSLQPEKALGLIKGARCATNGLQLARDLDDLVLLALRKMPKATGAKGIGPIALSNGKDNASPYAEIGLREEPSGSGAKPVGSVDRFFRNESYAGARGIGPIAVPSGNSNA